MRALNIVMLLDIANCMQNLKEEIDIMSRIYFDTSSSNYSTMYSIVQLLQK